MDGPALECLRAAGRVASDAREWGARQITPGASVREVCEGVEERIRQLGGRLAFPVQSSRNDVAAHDCPGPLDEACYAEGDLAKLDLGVHVDGWVVDTATTVHVGGAPSALIAAAHEALAAGIAAVSVGGSVRDVSIAIERRIRGAGLRPMRNLCGHGVGRWRVHGPPPVPNELLPAEPDARLAPGTLVAIEPFVTDGAGRIRESGPAEVFSLVPGRGILGDGIDAEVLAAIEGLRGLPFARRQLRHLPRERVERTLVALSGHGVLRGYPPLAESSGRPVAQAEHTLRIGVDGIEVLTR